MKPALLNVPSGANGTGTTFDSSTDPTFPHAAGIVALIDGAGTWTVQLQYILPGTGSTWINAGSPVAVTAQAAGVGALVALPYGRKFRAVVTGWSTGQPRVQIGDPVNPGWA